MTKIPEAWQAQLDRKDVQSWAKDTHIDEARGHLLLTADKPRNPRYSQRFFSEYLFDDNGNVLGTRTKEFESYGALNIQVRVKGANRFSDEAYRLITQPRKILRWDDYPERMVLRQYEFRVDIGKSQPLPYRGGDVALPLWGFSYDGGVIVTNQGQFKADNLFLSIVDTSETFIGTRTISKEVDQVFLANQLKTRPPEHASDIKPNEHPFADVVKNLITYPNPNKPNLVNYEILRLFSLEWNLVAGNLEVEQVLAKENFPGVLEEDIVKKSQAPVTLDLKAILDAMDKPIQVDPVSNQLNVPWLQLKKLAAYSLEYSGPVGKISKPEVWTPGS